jgi:hypothetical protein
MYKPSFKNGGSFSDTALSLSMIVTVIYEPIDSSPFYRRREKRTKDGKPSKDSDISQLNNAEH